jgi:hypothetical protein
VGDLKFSLAFFIKALSWYILLLYNADFALVAQDTMGLMEFLSSTKQIRQFPAIDKSL